MQGFFDEVALELACQAGERLPVLVNAYERRDLDGKPRFIRLTIYKATHRRLYEENLRYARTIAKTRLADKQATSVLREQFIAVLGHDLRNPPEALEKLFQPFTREDTRSSQNGLGLGLYIASEIARAHKGELTVASNAKETCFTFRMPTSA